ncbi:MAG: S-layer homology domain-containing protein [Armatimonadetes bacterium]|nr:S-layer homology domain-containing protein [Armatimonadota bacterium]
MRRENRWASPLALGLLFLLALSIPASAEAVVEYDFPDVPPWNWSWEYVQAICNAGISEGYDDGAYRPEKVVTRDQMAVYVARAISGGDEYVPTGPATATFPDVPNTGYGLDGTEPYWAYRYVECVVAADVVQGYPEGDYRPAENVTRGQMAVFMARAMCGGEAYVPIATGNATFPDVPTDHWCFDYVEYIAGEGVTQGFPDGTYRPDGLCTRDQMAVYICRAFSLPMPDSPYDVTEHFPLGGGDTWVYEATEGVYSKTVSGIQEVDGVDYAQIINQTDGGIDYWRGAPEGLYLGGFYDPEEGTITFNPPVLIPNGLFPADTGSQATTAYQDGTTELGPVTLEWTFVAVEDITVPAGTFSDCMKLHINMNMGDGGTDEFHLWVARGVGIVKRDTGSFGGDDWEILLSADVGRAQYPSNVGPFTVAQYYPRRVGTKWVYDSPDGDSVAQIVGRDEVGGIEAVRISESSDTGWPTARYFSLIDGAFCFVGEYDGYEDTTTTLLPPIAFPVSVQIGDSGVETSTAYVEGTPVGRVTFEWAVVGAGPVTTSAGTFSDAIKMRIAITDPSDDRSETYSWMALGVGPVKEDERPFEGTWWTDLIAADIGSLHYPTTGQTFDIQDYADYTVGNTWDYGGTTHTVTGTLDYGGHTWAAVETSLGETTYWRTDETGLYHLGYDLGGGEYRYDPPFNIPAGLTPGDSGTQTCGLLLDGTPVDTTYFAYEFEDIAAVSAEAGVFADCMKVYWEQSSSPDPETSHAFFWARSVGLVKEQVSSTATDLTAAEINGFQYPPDEMVFDVIDYYPLEVGNAWSAIWLGEWVYTADRVLIPSTEDLSGLGVTDTVYRVLRYTGDAADLADYWASLPEGLARYGHWDPDSGDVAVNPPLLVSNGISIGDSDSQSSTLYAWAVDHWESVGAISGGYTLVAAGAVGTSAGYFPDCILLRYELTPPGDDTFVQYVWLARGVGPVLEYEVNDGEFCETMGATIGGVTVPPDPATAVVESATITEGFASGFDFSADGMAALPDDQDLTYVYVSATNAGIESFDSSGLSRCLGQGDWDFISLHSYSTFLPPEWDLWGWTWWSAAPVLETEWDGTDSVVVVKTREGRYALVHITDITPTGLNIEYVYPYGWF